MKRTLIFGAIVATLLGTTGAMAQRWDREDDHYDRGRDVPGRILRSLEGRSDCHMVVERHRNRDGDLVVRRYRECD